VRLGHQGLFAERIDADLLVEDGSGGYEENPRTVPYAQLLYHVRNRTLSPGLGRWLQRDPNATGQPVVATLKFHGNDLYAYVVNPDVYCTYTDGNHLSQYCGSNPANHADPNGLEFSMIGTALV